MSATPVLIMNAMCSYFQLSAVSVVFTLFCSCLVFPSPRPPKWSRLNTSLLSSGAADSASSLQCYQTRSSWVQEQPAVLPGSFVLSSGVADSANSLQCYQARSSWVQELLTVLAACSVTRLVHLSSGVADSASSLQCYQARSSWVQELQTVLAACSVTRLVRPEFRSCRQC